MCVADQTNSRLPKVKGSKVWPTNFVALGTHMCVEFKAAPMDQGLKVWPATCCCEHTHCQGTCALQNRLDQTRVAPTDQGLQRFGRATADVSIHMCIAECICETGLVLPSPA